MLHWRVIFMAALAVLLLLAGLAALIMPESYEGQEVYQLNEMHAVRALDAMGLILIGLGGILSWSAGAAWQRKMYGS